MIERAARELLEALPRCACGEPASVMLADGSDVCPACVEPYDDDAIEMEYPWHKKAKALVTLLWEPTPTISRIYDRLDALILDGKLAEIDTVLRDVDVTVLDPVMALAYLSVTYQVRGQLEEWEPLRKRARDEYLSRGISAAKVGRLFWSDRKTGSTNG